jgi:hypothetical protein
MCCRRHVHSPFRAVQERAALHSSASTKIVKLRWCKCERKWIWGLQNKMIVMRHKNLQPREAPEVQRSVNKDRQLQIVTVKCRQSVVSTAGMLTWRQLTEPRDWISMIWTVVNINEHKIQAINMIVCFLLGNSPASEFYMLTFHLHRQVGVEPAYEDATECSETSAYKIQTPGNYPEESIQHSEHGESLKSRILSISLRNVNVRIFINVILRLIAYRPLKVKHVCMWWREEW